MRAQVVEKIEGVGLKDDRTVDQKCRPVVHVKKVISTARLACLILWKHIACLSPCDAIIELQYSIYTLVTQSYEL